MSSTNPPIVVQGTPVVVQGTPVVQYQDQQAYTAPPAAAASAGSGGGGSNTFSGKGEKQETKCRDPIFALLFYAAVAAIVAVAVVYGPDAIESATEDENGDPIDGSDYTGVVIATVIVVLVSFLAAGAALAIMMCIPETLIKVSLIFVTVLAGVWMVVSFMAGEVFMGILGLFFFAVSVCYAKLVWPRIPFATVNLVTAITAIKANLGVTFYAYLLTAVAGMWSICWSIAYVGVFDQTYECDENDVCSDPNYGLLFLLFVAYFFVHQVLQNSVHVTVAGTVGHWWFEPAEASKCCSMAVNNAFIRTVTTSFGSICFGSLIVAILQALRALANAARNQDDGILLCIAECIIACLASIVEYFNKWAFVYVGLYGYSYIDAAKNVFTLFKNRGWEAVIADDLVSNVLFLMSLVVGGVMGALTLALHKTTDLFEDMPVDSKSGTAFFLGFIVGLVITSILMSLIGSGVNSVIVLFADSPTEFQRNHPQLSERMRQEWGNAFPGII